VRDFGKVAPQFWTGKTGKTLRGCMEAQVVALYLMTSPHATMIGVYSLPMLYLIHETGLTEEGASKGLARCIEAGFCVYDAEAETVFVVNMAAHQIGDVLKPGDKRGGPVRSQYRAISSPAIKASFFDRYGVAFGLESVELGSPFEGASEGAYMPPSPSPSPSLEGGAGETDDAEAPSKGKAKGTVTLTTYLANCEAEGAEAIPAGDAVFAYAEQVGLPREFLALAWRWFKGKYGPDGSGKAKRYTDWRAVFRNAVKECWPKYWAIDQSGAYYLTTQGKQAQREFSDAG